jgi:hypothetical protein
MEQVTAFLGEEVVARGERAAVVAQLRKHHPAALASIRAFEDGSGRVVDLDFRAAAGPAPPPPPPPRGRPSLGVAAREVTLLPRHWEWLARQPGGASAAIRRLVEEARRTSDGTAEKRDSAYRFMSDMCGDRPGYEEALRALYRGENERLSELIAEWPEDIRGYIERLLA